ncbi:MAG: NgoFVII family restriction endonuclease [Ignavibacteriales bacterium]
MKIINYATEQFNEYCKNLKLVSSISKLFSSNDVPMIYYRATEFIYCKSFGAEDLSRSDVSADARLGNIGIGIKTFLEGNKKTFQKVAEFNKQSEMYTGLSVEDKIKKIALLRNERIIVTQKMYNLDTMIYHCIVRNARGLNIYEESMDLIDIDKINISSADKNTIKFSDGKHNYSFSNTKSTLYKQFVIDDYFETIDIVILEDPLLLLHSDSGLVDAYSAQEYEFVVLPLYSQKKGTNFVFEKSGLNQWNADGRKRNEDEVYIPFPSEVREKYRDFFPSRNVSFNAILPNGERIKMKICQENDKAIMSNPNKVLGKWLLRDVLRVPSNTLVTYEQLLTVGIDSVLFEKRDGEYYLNFKEIGSYEEFLNSFI